MLLTNEHCEVSCPNYKKYTVIFFSPTLLEVHWDMCSSRHPQPERSDVCPTPKSRVLHTGPEKMCSLLVVQLKFNLPSWQYA